MRTGHSAQIRLASRDDPPFSGKKISGSKSRHRALSCHGTKWCTLALPRNYILVILDHSGLETQVRGQTFSDLGPLVSSPPEIVAVSPATCKPQRALFPQSAWLTILVSLLDEIAKKPPSFPQVTHM
jgi:hypothetical protein